MANDQAKCNFGIVLQDGLSGMGCTPVYAMATGVFYASVPFWLSAFLPSCLSVAECTG